MKKTVIIIDAPVTMLEEYDRVGKLENDNVYFICKEINDELRAKNNIKIFDIKTQYFKIKEWLSEEFETIDAIYSISEDTGVEGTRLAAEFGISLNPVYSIINNRDKLAMKKVWQENNVCTAKYVVCNSVNEIEKVSMPYPLILKPSLGYASSCVVKIFNEDELRNYIVKTTMIDRIYISNKSNVKSRIILEEFIDGYEYSVDSLWLNGNPIVHFIASKNNPQGPLFKDHIYIADPNLDPNLRKLITAEVEKAIKASGYLTGATHVEVRIHNGECYLIESACRPGGSGIMYKVFGLAYDTNVFQMFYKLYTVKTEKEYFEYVHQINCSKEPPNMAFLYIPQHTGKGEIFEIKGIDDLRKRNEVKEIIMMKKAGDKLMEQDIDMDYVGLVFAKIQGNSENRESALELADFYDKTIDVICK